MGNSTPRTLRRLGHSIICALAFLLAAQVAATEQADPPLQKFDARSFNVVLAVLPGWKAKIVKNPPGAVFQYVDEPARTNFATIGVFRLVVPAEARGYDRAQLGQAYAINDLSGTQVALFKIKTSLVLASNVPNTIGDGQLLSYVEDIDATDHRLRSTKFVRAWIFFPKTFARDGGLYLLLGHETFRDLELKPVHLERATEIIAGLHEP